MLQAGDNTASPQAPIAGGPCLCWRWAHTPYTANRPLLALPALAGHRGHPTLSVAPLFPTVSASDLPPPAPANQRTGAPVLKAVALGAQRGERPLFRGLGLSLGPGQVVWLRGRNGRGKTTLLRILAGLAPAARGLALLEDQPVNRLPEALRTRLLYLAHANGLKDDLTATEALHFLARLQGARPTAAELGAALARVGMGAQAKAQVRTLSQGQRRRVALARLALCLGEHRAASVWLLDEPFDALDDEGVQMLNALLAQHAGAGGSALLTSHQAVTLAEPTVQVLDLDPFAFQPARRDTARAAA